MVTIDNSPTFLFANTGTYTGTMAGMIRAELRHLFIRVSNKYTSYSRSGSSALSQQVYGTFQVYFPSRVFIG